MACVQIHYETVKGIELVGVKDRKYYHATKINRKKNKSVKS